MTLHEKDSNKEKKIELVSKLNYEGVDKAAELITSYFSEKYEKNQITRLRLSIEECLNVWCENAGPEDEFQLKIKKVWNGYLINVIADGKALDPYEKGEGERCTEFSHRLLVELGVAPEYKRRENANELVYRLHKKPMNPVVKILCVIASAIVLGILMTNFLPTNIVTGFNEGFLTPLYTAFFRLLGTIAGPMIFLSVAWGIYGIGDTITLGRIGKKLFAIFVIVDFVFAIISLVGYPLLGPALSKNGASSHAVSDIFQMLLDIIPNSIIQPFADGNTLQIIFMAILVGTAMLYLGRRTETVALLIEQINYLVQYLMKLIADTVPLITFLVVLNLMISGAISVVSDSWKLLALAIPCNFICLIILLIGCAIFLKVKPLLLVKKILPLFTMSLTTASSSACFGINIQTTKDKLGVDSSLAAFGVPLGMVLSKLGAVVYFPLLCFYFSNCYGIELSLQLIVSLLISCVFIAIASPPIPGGAVAAYAILFKAVGIPEEAMAVAIALNVVMDFVMTSVNVSAIPLQLAVLGKITGKLNREKLIK